MITVLLVSALACSSPAAKRQGGPVWIDCDPAIGIPLADVDDGWALMHAVHAFPGSIAGIGLGYGNTSDIDYQEYIASEIVAAYSPVDIPIYRGATQPGDDDTDAVHALAAAAASQPLTVLTLGRLTNIAATLATYPEVASNIREIVILGGRQAEWIPSFGPAALKLPDSNVEADIAAVQILFDSAIPLTLIPNELTTQVVITESDLRMLRERGDAGRYLADESQQWWGLNDGLLGQGGFFPYDLFVTAYADDLLQPLIGCDSRLAQIGWGPDESFKQREGDVPRVQVSDTYEQGRAVSYCDRVAVGAKAEFLSRLVEE